MIYYFTFALMWGIWFECIICKMEGEITPLEKILNIMIWPLTLIIFLKSLFNNKI
jgi:hypothetical protein